MTINLKLLLKALIISYNYLKGSRLRLGIFCDDLVTMLN
jgi:hypothetical protein